METSTSAAGLGARLAAAREAAGLSLAEAAERLHLDASTLQGLEHEQYQTLGAAVYVRGHLRRYAELLGLPVVEIETAYGLTATAVSGMPDLRRVATPITAPGAPAWALRPGPAVAVAALLAGAALFWWAMRAPRAPRSVAPAETPADTRAETPASVTPAAPPAVQSPSAVTPNPVSAIPQQDLEVGKGPQASVQLSLQFRESSWVEIYDAAGQRLLYELGEAGSQRALHGSAPLRILLGNPSGVNLALDGHPVTFDQPPRGDSPLRLSLDGSGRVLEVRSAVTAARP